MKTILQSEVPYILPVLLRAI